LSLDLAFDDSQQAVSDSLDQFCAARCDEKVVKSLEATFPTALWLEIAELGVLGLATEEGDGGALEAVAACEALGRAVFPGPLPATFLATQVLAPEDRAEVANGTAVVSVAAPPILPWGPAASVFIEVESGRAWKCAPKGEVTAEATLGGERWGRGELERVEELGCVARGLALYDTTAAAYLAAAGTQLVAVTAEHVRTRKQFGKTLGEFQAVAHPLADCQMALAAAATLARAAGFRFDAQHPASRATAAAARLSAARAALDTAYTCHQLFGALGITLEGPVFHISRRIRQIVSQPPGDAAARVDVLREFGL
jgi:alkylation response protein AidB-like acyl-CoA dehydrogenase